MYNPVNKLRCVFVTFELFTLFKYNYCDNIVLCVLFSIELYYIHRSTS